ncbi:MAG: maleylpyruvate isomerase family mycothiol-dependent enzyme [Streptosporangiales bacterium]|nr:maleylpyruvate isomerase family mycothiol-dependent enzyme [Streptosporangiales bacterium]
MDSAAYLTHLRNEMTSFAACLDGDLDTPVEHCGDWTLYDLADHLGNGHLWSAAAVTERRKDYRGPAAPRDPKALATWFDQTCTVLLTVLDTDPSTEAWTFFPPHTVAFWQRRRCLEALVHRWDAEHAVGRPGKLDPTLAADGVSEVFDTMAPRQVKRGRADEPDVAVRFTADDAGTSWTYGPGEPVAEVSGSAADLLLLLWHRLDSAAPSLAWQGDRAAGQRLLAGLIVP